MASRAPLVAPAEGSARSARTQGGKRGDSGKSWQERVTKAAEAVKAVCLHPVVPGVVLFLGAIALAVAGEIFYVPLKGPPVAALAQSLDKLGMRQEASEIHAAAERNVTWTDPFFGDWDGLKKRVLECPLGDTSFCSFQSCVETGNVSLCRDLRCGALTVNGTQQCLLAATDGAVFTSPENFPLACRQILSSDIASAETEDCNRWCEALYGERPSYEYYAPYCSDELRMCEVVASAARACSRARTGRLTVWFRSPTTTTWVMVSYVSFAIFFLFCCCCCCCEDVSSGVPSEKELYGEKSSDGLEKMPLPCCCLPAVSDKYRALAQTFIRVPVMVTSHYLTMASVLTFAGAGQMVYCFLTGAVVFPITDLLNTMIIRASFGNLQRFFPTKQCYEYQARQGLLVAPLVTAILIFSLLSSETLRVNTFKLRVATATLGVLFTIPDGCLAAAMLVQAEAAGEKKSLDDYAWQETTKMKLPYSIRFGMTARLFGGAVLAGTVGLSRPGVALLVLQGLVSWADSTWIQASTDDKLRYARGWGSCVWLAAVLCQIGCLSWPFMRPSPDTYITELCLDAKCMEDNSMATRTTIAALGCIVWIFGVLFGNFFTTTNDWLSFADRRRLSLSELYCSSEEAVLAASIRRKEAGPPVEPADPALIAELQAKVKELEEAIEQENKRHEEAMAEAKKGVPGPGPEKQEEQEEQESDEEEPASPSSPA